MLVVTMSWRRLFDRHQGALYDAVQCMFLCSASRRVCSAHFPSPGGQAFTLPGPVLHIVAEVCRVARLLHLDRTPEHAWWWLGNVAAVVL